MNNKTPKRHPDALTSHLANGHSFGPEEARWIKERLEKLRAARSRAPSDVCDLSFSELKRTYMRSRMIQGAVVGGRQALSVAIEAGGLLRAGEFQRRFEHHAHRGMKETEKFLTGNKVGSFLKSNDYPLPVKEWIAALAGFFEGPNEKAFQCLLRNRPELVELAHDADELQRLSWAFLRRLIDQAVPHEEIAEHRAKPLSQGTEELLSVIKEKVGPVPARVMQRDDWKHAFESPRQDSTRALFNEMKYFVEVSEISVLYCLGSTLARIKLGRSTDQLVPDLVRHGVQDIATGTRRVTHRARFQSRIGARPNDYRSFAEFLRNVGERASSASLGLDGSVNWADTPGERGWCPIQNLYRLFDSSDEGIAALSDLVIMAEESAKDWTKYAYQNFHTAPAFAEPTPAELIACVVVFATLNEGGALRPDSPLLAEWATLL